jgi:hypothetical protein
MLTTSSLHSPGFWDHMPPPRERHIVMNDGPQDELSDEPTLPARRIKSSHANAWILVAAVGATGAALAVANMHSGTLHEAIAEVRSFGHHDNEKLADATPPPVAQSSQGVLQPAAAPAAEEGRQLAQAEAPATPAVHAAKPAPALPPMAPAAGRSMTQAAPKQLGTLSATSSTQELRETQAPPTQMAPVNAVTPVAPITPVPSPAPVTVPLPPPVQAPASAPPTQTAATEAMADGGARR